MHLAGRDRNWKRDWNTKTVQTVLTEYGDPDSMTDWTARVAEITEATRPAPAVLIPQKPPETAPQTAPDAPGAAAAPAVPPEYLPDPPEPIQSTDVTVDKLFYGISPENVTEWRFQLQAEQEERNRLIRKLTGDDPIF